MHQIVQCTPGVVELVLIPLRQRLEERRRRRKQGSGSLQVPPTQTSPPALRELPSLQKAPTVAISAEEGCLVKGSLAWGTVGGRDMGSFGDGRAGAHSRPRDSFRSWFPRMAVATWMWVKWLLLSLPPRGSFSPFLPWGERGGKDRKIGLQKGYSTTYLFSGLSQKSRGEGAQDTQGGGQLR